MSKLDQSHIFKAVYSEKDRALKTVPSESTSFEINLNADDGDSAEIRSHAIDTITLIDKQSASSKLESSSVNMLKYKHMCIVANWNDCSDTNAELILQMSLDNDIFIDTDSSILLNDPSGAEFLNLNYRNYKYFRISYNPKSTTAGTYSVKYCLKG